MDINSKFEEIEENEEQTQEAENNSGAEENSILQEKEREPIVFTARDWLVLLASLGLGIICEKLFGAIFNTENIEIALPSLGITVIVFLFVATALIYLGKKARYSIANILLLSAVLLLALSCTLFGNTNLRVMNYVLIISVGAMTMFQISGQAKHLWSRVSVMTETMALGFISLFFNIDKPFRAATFSKKGKGHSLELIIGAIIAVPVLAIILSLLISADVVFGDMVENMTNILRETDIYDTMWDLFKAMIYMLLLFSVFYSMGQRRDQESLPEISEKGDVEEKGSVVFATVLILLNIVYIAFVTIQIKFLFGGAETAAISGGYAEYARNGFFQLVFVSMINLGAVLITIISGFKRAGKNRKILKGLCVLMLVLTCVILVSALWRMLLYISVYGLSLLRMLTLWGMAVIAVGLVLAGAKSIKESIKFFPVIFAFALGTWIILNYINVGAFIANYNVDAYFDGRVEQLDIHYISYLSADAEPALRRIVESEWEGDEADEKKQFAAIAINRITSNAKNEKEWIYWNASSAGLNNY